MFSNSVILIANIAAHTYHDSSVVFGMASRRRHYALVHVLWFNGYFHVFLHNAYRYYTIKRVEHHRVACVNSATLHATC